MVGIIRKYDSVLSMGSCGTFSKSARYVGLIFAVILLSCWGKATSGELYVIAETDTVFVGGDFDYYDVGNCDLGFTKAGKARWSARLYSENHRGLSTPQPSTLTGREFRLEVDGEVISVGHFSSEVSSRMYSGLVIWDSVVFSGPNSVRLSFSRQGMDGEAADPRESEKFLNFFRSQGKLVGSGSER